MGSPVAFELLQKPVGTLDLLLYLSRKGKSSVVQIISETGLSRGTFYSAAERLRSMGFAYEDPQTGYPSYTYWGLTRDGEAVARALAPAADLVSSTASSMERELARLEEANDPATAGRRLELLDLLADREYEVGQWDRAQAASERLIVVARQAKDVRREIRGHLAIGNILQKRDRHEDARRELDEALRLALEAKEEGLASEAEYLIACDLERIGKWAEASERFASSGAHGEAAGDPLQAARARQAAGRILHKRTRYEEALAVFLDVAAELERLGAEDDLPRVYIAIGSAYANLDRDTESDLWYTKGVEAAQRVGDVRMEAYGLVYASGTMMHMGQYRRAEAALVRGGQILEALGERSGVGGSHMNLAQLCVRERRWSAAEDHFDQALAIARETSNPQQEAWTMLNRGQMERKRGGAAGREMARKWITQARAIFLEIGSEARVKRCDLELKELNEVSER